MAHCVYTVCVQVFLQIDFAIYISICLSINLSFNLFINLSCNLSITVYIYILIHLFIYLSIYLSIHISIFISFYVYISISIYVYLSIYYIHLLTLYSASISQIRLQFPLRLAQMQHIVKILYTYVQNISFYLSIFLSISNYTCLSIFYIISTCLPFQLVTALQQIAPALIMYTQHNSNSS